MTNTELLEPYIEASGFKKEYIAKEIGLDYRTFKNRLDNVTEFKASEIEKLCRLLKITKLTERQKIFFAQKVD